MRSQESPDDIATLAALDFATPALQPPSARTQTRRAASGAITVVLLSLLLLALIISRPFLPDVIFLALTTLWAVALSVTIYGLTRVSRSSSSAALTKER